MKQNKSIEKLKESFAHSFHEQFAINQNTQFTLLITIAVSLATVLGGLGYVIGKFCSENKLAIGNNSLIYTAANCAAALYGYGVVLLVSAMSFSFRRDQLILNNLRNELDMFKDKKSRKQYLAIFPQKYSGEQAFKIFPFYHFNWMPNHYAVITRIVLIMLFLVNLQFYIFLVDAKLLFQFQKTLDFKLLILGIFIPLFFVFAGLTPTYYKLWFNRFHRGKKPKNCFGRILLYIGKKIP
ncbi:hypothetical protein EHR01_12420 [Leptospira mtsangambouensis]|uniref:Uncharacterized protein n=1 Tax=Leptospira mtsangambouensis TaxID=2484912 RepID=A0ABY2NYS2_9LEPT|nr:hypothetical protein [Leptospira mtsangambouensis]TGM74300.1 hypothetical protein EHR01_12420 [Leptospira mtsangambouensis]